MSGNVTGSFTTGYEAYWRRTASEVEEAIKNSVIVLDTNAIINVYRMAPKGRAEYLAVLANVSDRLWVPQNVVAEFHRTRLSAVASHIAGLKSKSEAVGVAAESLKVALKDFARLYSLADGRAAEYMEPLDVAIAGILQHVAKDVEAFDLDPSDLVSADPILDRLSRLLEGKVGEGIDEGEMPGVLAEAKRRGEGKIPPGYKDYESKGEEGFGDFLIWQEILKFAKSDDRGILFVSSDAKEDWFRRQAGFVVGPRPELVKEMREEANSAYHHLTLADFLRKASSALGVFVSPNTISQAKELESELTRLARKDLIRRLKQIREELSAAMAENTQRVHEVAVFEERVAMSEHELNELSARADGPDTVTVKEWDSLRERAVHVNAGLAAAKDGRAIARLAAQRSQARVSDLTAAMHNFERMLDDLPAE
ncbi:PIN-like domain-containing protein [Streptomyces sp. NPDC005732]|uniref:PIN-like domain-containing protein n=1 Tax=Streptomyces sp. NPDC005732 TaxID=3157057 RepID=UPI003400E76C